MKSQDLDSLFPWLVQFEGDVAWSNDSHPLQDFFEAGVGRFLLSFKDRRV